MTEPTLVLVTAIFLLAGLVKGVIGLGLPTVSLGLLVMMVELPTAMALMLVPSFVTNIWQSLWWEYAISYQENRIVFAGGHTIGLARDKAAIDD